MIVRLVLATLLLAGIALPAATTEKKEFTFTYVGRADDPSHAEQRAYAGLKLRQAYPAIDGARQGVRENRIRGRAINVSFSLETLILGAGQKAGDAVAGLVGSGQPVFLLDLPLGEMNEAAGMIARADAIAFNIRHPDDELRAGNCFDNLFHTMPSRAMLTDALAQVLRQRGWTKILVLEGEQDADKALVAALQRSARKFGLKIVDVRAFELSNDPRARDRNNIALLTRARSYDVVFLADSFGEFGRYVPYHTQLARPIVGTEGLVPAAWHWTMERYGAPQLNQRFEKRAKRSMTATDWAAWAAVKATVEAVVRTGKTDIPTIRTYMTSDAFTLDMYKGAAGSFRPWNQQLRQPILLGTHNAVITLAPLDEFLHQTNVLDTLGLEHQVSECRLDEQ